jgi:murein DD-endopeptidase MepM/ murein hydrolase activator NlpD
MNRHPLMKPIVGAAVLLIGLPLTLAPVVVMADDNSTDATQQQMTALSSDVSTKQAQLQTLDQQESDYQASIDQKKADSVSLQNDIAVFDDRIAQMQLDIDIANDQISQAKLDISGIDDAMKSQSDRITGQRQVLAVLARTLYRVQFHKSIFDILLSNESLSDFFDAMRQIADLQAGVSKSLQAVNALNAQMSQEKQSRESDVSALSGKESALAIAQRELEDERDMKQAVLDETQSSEQQYRYLLGELKQQQDDADSEITYLDKTTRSDAGLASRLDGQDAVLAWPIVPSRGISTKFHDPDYPFRYLFEHPGIDIPTPQGTPVRAAAAGVVARAEDGGMAYSYVMVIHNDNISTVYGHLSKIVAKEDSFVERGEIIGYSGGTPGTPGAGPLTTGPHLHFETRLHGIPVDPMQYLSSLSDAMAMQ